MKINLKTLCAIGVVSMSDFCYSADFVINRSANVQDRILHEVEDGEQTKIVTDREKKREKAEKSLESLLDKYGEKKIGSLDGSIHKKANSAFKVEGLNRVNTLLARYENADNSMLQKIIRENKDFASPYLYRRVMEACAQGIIAIDRIDKGNIDADDESALGARKDIVKLFQACEESAEYMQKYYGEEWKDIDSQKIYLELVTGLIKDILFAVDFGKRLYGMFD